MQPKTKNRKNQSTSAEGERKALRKKTAMEMFVTWINNVVVAATTAPNQAPQEIV